jgi:hypothetical protein
MKARKKTKRKKMSKKRRRRRKKMRRKRRKVTMTMKRAKMIKGVDRPPSRLGKEKLVLLRSRPLLDGSHRKILPPLLPITVVSASAL